MRRCGASGGHDAPETEFGKKSDGSFKRTCNRHLENCRRSLANRRALAQATVAVDDTRRFCSAAGGHSAPVSEFSVRPDGSYRQLCDHHTGASRTSNAKRRRVMLDGNAKRRRAMLDEDGKDGYRTCTRCLKRTSVGDVHDSTKATAYCKSCHAKEIARWKAIGVKRRIMARSMLAVPCEKCGEDRICALQHAHRKASTKKSVVAKCRSRVMMEAERAKTRPLCIRCHMAETIAEKTGGRLGRQRLSADGKVRVALVEAELLGDRFHGQCQFPGCTVTASRDDPVATRRSLAWIVRDPRDTESAGPSISTLVTSDINGRLASALALRVPLCTPHHEIVRLYRLRGDPRYVIDKQTVLPSIWMEAEAATVASPDAYLRVLSLPTIGNA